VGERIDVAAENGGEIGIDDGGVAATDEFDEGANLVRERFA
jgi:hypothetical protein